MTPRRVLLASYEVPCYGGASTSAYRLSELLRGHGLHVVYVNLIEECDADFYAYAFGPEFGNPRGLPDVHTCSLTGRLWDAHPELTELVRRGTPDVMVGVGHIATVLLKRASPGTPVVFLTSGCRELKLRIESGEETDFATFTKRAARAIGRPHSRTSDEREAVETADLIVAHSDMTLGLYQRFFPFHAGKLYRRVIWFAEWIHGEALPYAGLARPFTDRDIDVLFVASSWARPEKNYPLVRELVAQLRDVRVHIVGEVNRRIDGAVYHGLVHRETVFALMARAKVVVCPSLFDSAPGVLFEASAMGCNVVASPNCGNWQLCHDELLAEPGAPHRFAAPIRRALSAKFPDRINQFLQAPSSRHLADTLAVV